MTKQVQDREIIKVENLCKGFGELKVLRNINQHVNMGEVVSIIGPSGSGKSTFLRCLNLLEVPDSGKITFEGVEITDKKIDIDKHRQKMGMVFQHFNVFPNMTVLENITLAPILEKKVPKEQAQKEAEELLKKVGLLEKKDEYPRKLSGGQKQRLAIVRAMAMKPDVILFDEPTSALDPEMVMVTPSSAVPVPCTVIFVPNGTDGGAAQVCLLGSSLFPSASRKPPSIAFAAG